LVVMTVAGDPAAARRDIDGGAEAIIVVQRLPAAVVRVVVARGDRHRDG
jgi:hypothetical protein